MSFQNSCSSMAYVLARYLDDNVLYYCKSAKVRPHDDDIKLVQFSDKQWYKALIIKQGSKNDMIRLKKNMERPDVTSTRRCK